MSSKASPQSPAYSRWHTRDGVEETSQSQQISRTQRWHSQRCAADSSATRWHWRQVFLAPHPLLPLPLADEGGQLARPDAECRSPVRQSRAVAERSALGSALRPLLRLPETLEEEKEEKEPGLPGERGHNTDWRARAAAA